MFSKNFSTLANELSMKIVDEKSFMPGEIIFDE